MADSRSAPIAVPSGPAGARRWRGRSDRPPGGARPPLDRQVDAAGNALTDLAVATDGTAGSAPGSTQPQSRSGRMGAALRRVSEELAIERRRSGALREEIRQLRAQLVEADRIRTFSALDRR
jgi:hypothetical protein